MNILILGKNGQVGHALQQTLAPLGNIVALGRAELDLNNTALVIDALNTYQPNIIVNAAAYTAVDKAEDDQATAYQINATLPATLAQYALAHDALLIHYSSDYVFDGTKQSAYVEDDVPNPQNVYGDSKYQGEEAIINSKCKGLIFRTSWVFSAHGQNFVKTILRLAKEKPTLNVIADQYGVPTNATFIAEITALAITEFSQHNMPSGIYHLAPTGKTTWHGIACQAVQRAHDNGNTLMLGVNDINAIPTSAYPLPAKRPQNSCLNTSKLSTALNVTFPPWEAHVNLVIDQLTLSDTLC